MPGPISPGLPTRIYYLTFAQQKLAETIFSEMWPLLFLEGLPIPVGKAKHLAALKVFAVKNDPERAFR
jgi:hypothetical protein